ncbi:hypothetical protein MD484_g7403, partial [Candolleomyces efflorescens]
MYVVTWITSTGNSILFLLLTLFKLKTSVANADPEGLSRIRYDKRLRDKTVVSPLLVTFVRDGASNFLILTGKTDRHVCRRELNDLL